MKTEIKLNRRDRRALKMGRKGRILAERYKRMASSIEDAKIYDGRGTIDVYVCCNGHKVYTTYKDKGVTPFTMPCPYCGVTMVHNDTVSQAPEGEKVLNWFRPALEEFLFMSPAIQQHVLDGGLILDDRKHEE